MTVRRHSRKGRIADLAGGVGPVALGSCPACQRVIHLGRGGRLVPHDTAPSSSTMTRAGVARRCPGSNMKPRPATDEADP